MWGLSLSLCTTSGTGELNGANNSVLCVHQFEALEVEVANLKCLAKTEVVDVDDNALGNCSVGSLNLNLLH